MSTRPLTLPWRTKRALQIYRNIERSRNVNREMYWHHVLLGMLDTMTPIQTSAYYRALRAMRARGDDLP